MTQVRAILEERTSVERMSQIYLLVDKPVVHFFLMDDRCGRVQITVEDPTPGMVVLRALRKQAKAK